MMFWPLSRPNCVCCIFIILHKAFAMKMKYFKMKHIKFDRLTKTTEPVTEVHWNKSFQPKFYTITLSQCTLLHCPSKKYKFIERVISHFEPLKINKY